MAGGWRVIDCSEMKGTIRSARGQIVVEVEERPPVNIPVADAAVILVGTNVRFSGATIHRLADADVAVLFTDWRGIPLGAAYYWGNHSRVGARQIAQANVSMPKKKALWAQLVKAKILGQAQTLKAMGRKNYGALQSMASDVRSGDPANLEGQAARLYWGSLFPGENFVREPGAGGGLNGLLDYGYTVVRGQGIRSVLSAGLNPALGVFHRGRGNAFNLVDDLIEPFRPVVDQLVASLPLAANSIDKETKKVLVSAISQPFSPEGYGVSTSFEKLAQSVGMYYEGDLKSVLVHSWNGELEQMKTDEDG